MDAASAALFRIGQAHHSAEARGARGAERVDTALAAQREARGRMAGLVGLEPGECARLDAGRYVRCREVQSQRVVTAAALLEAAALVGPADVAEAQARAAAAAAGGDGGARADAWWTCVLEGARRGGAVRGAPVLEFCAAAGRQEVVEIPEDARAAALAASAARDECRAARAAGAGPAEHEDGDMELVRALIADRGGSVRATVSTADGAQHVYSVRRSVRRRRPGTTPALLGSRRTRGAAGADIAAFMECAAAGGEAAAAAAARVLERAGEEHEVHRDEVVIRIQE